MNSRLTISPTGVDPRNLPGSSRSTLAGYNDRRGTELSAMDFNGHHSRCSVGGSFSALSARYDSSVLSAEASALTAGAHISTCSSPESTRYTAAGGISALQVGLQATYGDDDNALRLGAGTAFGVGGGFDYQRRLNEDGTTTRSLDVGLAAAGRFTLGATFTTLTPEERQATERRYADVLGAAAP